MMNGWLTALVLACLIGLASDRGIQADDDTSLAVEADQALRRACRFFREHVSTEGGYLWRYSSDLETREGEGRADKQTVWVQPPGTPSVGMALLDASRRLGDDTLLEMASDAGHCLVRGQLQSGGWDYRIQFDPSQRRRYAYRVDELREKVRNTSTLDDNATQAAVRLLVELDHTLQFQDPAIHDAAMVALQALIQVQYPNGAWPQRFDGPPNADDFPVRRASYPDSWSREFPSQRYSTFYTFNDNTIADTVDVLFLASRVYENQAYRKAAERAGDFILLAQMPEPQPGWAQQYNAQMHPAWARKFEPPSLTGGEAAGIFRTLIRIYQETGDRKYLEPIPRALAYYRRSVLPDGSLARFYELRSNRPLYFTRDYQLTYDDSDMPTHYAFKIGNWLPSVERSYESAKSQESPKPPRASTATPRLTNGLRQRARQVVAALDERGAWVEAGRMKYHGDDDPTRHVIDCRTFIQNVRVLSSYLAAVRAARGAEG